MIVVAAPAYAGDKPLIEPVPVWVRPVEPPPSPAPVGDVPITLLLSDQQMRFEQGSTIMYARTLIRIDTAQGLAAGNISLPWRPDVGDLRIHRLAIRRGETIIDVLAGGQTFTVARREPNLESATLDGVLTANIQPEGLQVGDVLELVGSVQVRDPVFAGHGEAMLALGGGLPMKRAHVRVTWPDTVNMRTRSTATGVLLKSVRDGRHQGFELTLDNLQPFTPPAYAPPRFQAGPAIELTDFAKWSELGALLAPLYERAALIPTAGPLAEEVAKIKAASPDPKVRALAALALVQDRVRYVALAMGAGGLTPADAAATWARRYGDCKAKTALLLAMFRALDITAEPVAVSLGGGDGIDARLPAIGAFNHVLVRATIAGKLYWLDGTRTGDTVLERLDVPNLGWGLPLVRTGAALVRMLPPPLTEPTTETHVAIDATAGLDVPAPTEVTQMLRGDEAVAVNGALANVAGEARDRALREYWKRQYDFIDVATTSATLDRATGVLRLAMAGKARMDWSSGWYETDGLSLGWKADFAREPGPGRDAPFAVAYPRFARSSETIKLPPGFPETLALDKVIIDRTVAGTEYRRSGSITGRVFRAVATERAIAPEFPAREAPAAQTALREMLGSTLYIRRPDSYVMSDADLTVAMTKTPKSALGFINRGNVLLDRARYAEAIKDFDAVLALEPKNAHALANRGISRVWQRDNEAAERDFVAAEAIDPRIGTLFRGRGLAAALRGDHQQAVLIFGKALEIDSKDQFALTHRARSHRALRQGDKALADAAAVLAIDPRRSDMRLLRTNVLRDAGKTELALAETRAGIAADPKQTYAYVVAANAHIRFGRRDDGMKLFDEALAVEKEPYIYINRATMRDAGDVDGKLGDLDAALELEPGSDQALQGKAMLLSKRGDHAPAISLLDKAVALHPGRAAPLVSRGIVRFRSGNVPAADADFKAARAISKASAEGLNNLCWRKATENVALPGALADCDAALALQPTSAAAMDSKAFVLLRMGRLDEAIAMYDRAVAASPDAAASLFGRSLARARKGDQGRADADRAAAVVLNKDIVAQFASYGMTS